MSDASEPGRGGRLTLTPTAYRRITLAAVALLAVIVVTGGAVRVTGSGLGCSDWPHCEDGSFVAPLEYHAWVEFGNRLFTGLVSIGVILAVLGSVVRRPKRRDLVLLSWGLVAGVVAQIVLGALVVRTHLVPAAVSAHFLLSMALIWNGLLLHRRADDRPTSGGPRSELVRFGVRSTTALAAVVLGLGTLVTGSGPHSGDPEVVDRLGFDIGTIARWHSSAVWLLVAVGTATVVALWRGDAPVAVRRAGVVMLAAFAAQGAIGYAQYFGGVPAALVLVHVAGAVTVWIAVVTLHLSAVPRRTAVPT